MAVTCPACQSEDLDLIETLNDTRLRLRCEHCGHDWLRGEAKADTARSPLSSPGPLVMFKDDDQGFRRWMIEHPGGYYLNAERNPTPNYLMLHEVGCVHVGDADESDVKWTTDYIKVCAPTKKELQEWARAEVGGEAIACRSCQP